MILSGEAMEPKVVRQLARALQPALTNVCVDWGEWSPFLVRPSAPATPKPLYDGSRASLYGVFRLRRDDGGELPPRALVRVTAESPDGELCWAMAVTSAPSGGDTSGRVDAGSAVDVGSGGELCARLVHHCTGRLIHTAAARCRIRDLEMVPSDGGRGEATSLAIR
jgi:hypothetical protein